MTSTSWRCTACSGGSTAEPGAWCFGGENPEYGQRELEDHAAKVRIAAGVAALLQDRGHVWLDSGTTATEIARQLRQREMTIMPMSLRAVTALSADEPPAGRRPELLLPGGSLVPGELSFRGPMAESNIRSLRFDTAVVTPCALNLKDGLLAHDLDDAAVKRAGLESAGPGDRRLRRLQMERQRRGPRRVPGRRGRPS